MSRRWLGSFVFLVGGLAVVPLAAHSTECPLYSSETLRLEPVSLEIGGMQVAGWADEVSEFSVSLSSGYYPTEPFRFTSGRPSTDGSYNGEYRHEAFDATASSR